MAHAHPIAQYSITANKVAPVAILLIGSVPSPGTRALWRPSFPTARDEEIYGEDEPAEYVHQVIGGAVRTYKLLSTDDARSARFILPGDVFGTRIGNDPPARGGSHYRYHRAPGETPSLRAGGGIDVQVARKLGP
jgi:CRP/FNR family nitrogen fixation transcriptional regulator